MTEQDCVTLKHVGFEQKFQNLNPSENVIKGKKFHDYLLCFSDYMQVFFPFI